MPLEGVRVIDLSVALAGPYCTLLLAGLGAEVIKIDAPGGARDIGRNNPPYVGAFGLNHGTRREGEDSLFAMSRLRGKKSITLDLKSRQGHELFLDLVKRTDVLVENFSDGTAERLGVGFDLLHTVNPGLIYASITGLGGGNAYGITRAMDVIVQALSGVMEVNGFPDGPPCRMGLPVGDLTGPHYALAGILAALFHRTRSGRGQRVMVNLLDSLVSLLALEHFDVFASEGKPLRTGNSMDRLVPFGVYPTLDAHIALAAPTDVLSNNLLRLLGRADLIGDRRFHSRGARAANAGALNALIENWSRLLTAEDAVRQLLAADIAAARVRTPQEALSDPALLRRRAIVPLTGRPGLPRVMAPGVPIQFSECDSGYRQPAAPLGAHNHEIYSGLLGVDEARLRQLGSAGVI